MMIEFTKNNNDSTPMLLHEDHILRVEPISKDVCRVWVTEGTEAFIDVNAQYGVVRQIMALQVVSPGEWKTPPRPEPLRASSDGV
jgi:hypothetical protein